MAVTLIALMKRFCQLLVAYAVDLVILFLFLGGRVGGSKFGQR